ncbi:MAG: hypothetical protein IRZ16_05985 [Myxococcaceae bacterium]|nr:hypothetical protein [Myxococcaceae bacterium]
MKPSTAGALGGALVAIAVVGVLALNLTGTKPSDQQIDSPPIQVLVAGQDVPANTKLTADMLTRRTIPQRYVNGAMLKPEDAARVVGREVMTPLKAGSTIEWQHFVALGGHPDVARCVQSIALRVDAAVAAERARAVDAFLDRAGRDVKPAAARGLPVVVPDANGNVTIVTAAVDVPVGTVLKDEMLTTASWPATFVTASKVPAADRAALVGRKVTAELQMGDPLQWQFVDDAVAPRSAVSCLLEADGVVPEAIVQSAAREAAAFFAPEVKK